MSKAPTTISRGGETRPVSWSFAFLSWGQMNPVLVVKTCEVILPLPSQARILVDKGEMVAPGKILAETEEKFAELSLPKLLKTSPIKIKEFLLVSPGAKIKEGQILASRKTLLGKTEIKSPVNGVATEILPEGVLKIKVADKEEVKSPIKGKIKESTETSLTLEFEATVLTTETGQGPQNWGHIEIIEKKEINLADLPKEASGKIFILPEAAPTGFIHKAEALGAVGVVAGKTEEGFKTVDLALLVAGKEGLIPREIWVTLKKQQGRSALISGEARILSIPLVD